MYIFSRFRILSKGDILAPRFRREHWETHPIVVFSIVNLIEVAKQAIPGSVVEQLFVKGA